jgi:hypothetical protein
VSHSYARREGTLEGTPQSATTGAAGHLSMPAKPARDVSRHADNLRGANTVTKDFLQFSQPFIHEGALLTSSSSGRRLYIHHLSEVPLSEVYSTLVGNQLQRVDKVRRSVELAVPNVPHVSRAPPLTLSPSAAQGHACRCRP